MNEIPLDIEDVGEGFGYCCDPKDCTVMRRVRMKDGSFIWVCLDEDMQVEVGDECYDEPLP